MASASRDKVIKMWDAKSGRCVMNFVGHDSWVNGIAFHPNGKYMLSVSDDKSIRIWDLNNARCYRKLLSAHSNFITCISMKQKVVITGGIDLIAKVWSCR